MIFPGTRARPRRPSVRQYLVVAFSEKPCLKTNGFNFWYELNFRFLRAFGVFLSCRMQLFIDIIVQFWVVYFCLPFRLQLYVSPNYNVCLLLLSFRYKYSLRCVWVFRGLCRD